MFSFAPQALSESFMLVLALGGKSGGRRWKQTGIGGGPCGALRLLLRTSLLRARWQSSESGEETNSTA